MADDFSDIPTTRSTTGRRLSYRRRPSRAPMILLIIALHAIPITVFLLYLAGVFSVKRSGTEAVPQPQAAAAHPVILPKAKPSARSESAPTAVPEPETRSPPLPSTPPAIPAAEPKGTAQPPAVPPRPLPPRSPHLPKWSASVGPDAIRSLAVAVNGRCVTGGFDRTARVWEPDSTELQTYPGFVGPHNNVAISRDGTTLLAGGNPPTQLGRVTVNNDCLLRAVTLKNRKATIVGAQATMIHCVAVSPNGRFALTGSERLIRYWDVQAGRDLRPGGFSGHAGVVAGVDFHPKQAQAVSVADDHTARIWDLRKGESIRTFTGLPGTPVAVAYRPDGRAILVSGPHAVGVLDVVSGAALLRAESTVIAAATAACWMPDGRIVVGGPGYVTLIDPTSGQETDHMDSAPLQIHAVGVSGDGRLVYAAGRGLVCWEMTAADPK